MRCLEILKKVLGRIRLFVLNPFGFPSPDVSISFGK